MAIINCTKCGTPIFTGAIDAHKCSLATIFENNPGVRIIPTEDFGDLDLLGSFPLEFSKPTINQWCEEIHSLAKEKGWWDEQRSPLEIHALIHSEVAEATEAARSGNDPMSIIAGKPEGEAVELADAVIRVMDYFQYKGWDLEETIRLKHEYNKTRPHRHGGKRY